MGFVKWLNKLLNPNHDWTSYDENGNMTGRGFAENLNSLFNPNHDWTNWDDFYANKATLKQNLNTAIQQLNDPMQVTSYVNGITGAHMQNAEFERNELNMQNQEDIYQRQVAGMQKAGLNPALMYQNGGASSAPTASPSSSNASFQDILSLFMAKKQMKILDAQAADLDASAIQRRAMANKAEQDILKSKQDIEQSKETTRATKLQNDYFEETRNLHREGLSLANDLTRKQIDEIESKIDNLKASTNQLVESAKTEEERRKALAAQAVLSHATAHRIYQLLPFEQAYTEARTEESKQAAALSMVQQAYQNGLINSGYIESMVRANNASASESETRKIIDDTKIAIEKGLSPDEVNKLPFGQRVVHGLYSGVHDIRQALTPFGR